MMVALLLYAYARGVRSSRAIERACVGNVAYRVIAAQAKPDHATIARFLERHQDALADVFGSVLGLCAKAGLVGVNVLAVDGTKVSANASREATVDCQRLGREVLKEARAVDAEEDERFGDRRGDELPPELATSNGRQQWFKEAKRWLEVRRATQAAPIPRDRPEHIKEAKRRMVEQLSTELRAEQAYQRYRAKASIAAECSPAGVASRGRSLTIALLTSPGGSTMVEARLLDSAGRRRSPASLPGYHAGPALPRRPAAHRGDHRGDALRRREPARRARPRTDRDPLARWTADPRSALADRARPRPAAGSVLVRREKGGRRREIGMDVWGFEHVQPWLEARREMPVGPLFCVIDGRTRGRAWSAGAAREALRLRAVRAGVRRRFAPHQLRHAHAIELAREGVPLNIIQRQLNTKTSALPRSTCKASTPARSSRPSTPADRR